MKLPAGVFTNPSVQSLGRRDVNAPVRVAKAYAGAAEKGVRAAEATVAATNQVGRNAVAIGNINMRSAQAVDQMYGRQIRRDEQFSANMLRLAGQGMDLTANIVKADATNDFNSFEQEANLLQEGMMGADAPRSVSQPRDPHKPNGSTKVISTADQLPTAVTDTLMDLKESYLKNANPWARGLLEQQMDEHIAGAELAAVQTAKKWQIDFSQGQVMETYNNLLLDKRFAEASKVLDDNSDIFTGKEREALQLKAQIEREAWDLENEVYGLVTENAGKTYEQQVKFGNSIKDSKTRKLYFNDIDKRRIRADQIEAQREKDIREAQDKVMGQQIDEFYAGKRLAADIEFPAPESPEDAQAYQRLKESMARGDHLVTNNAVLQELDYMSVNSPKAFSKVNLWTKELSIKDRDELRGRQRGVWSDDMSAQKAASEFQSTYSATEAKLKPMFATAEMDMKDGKNKGTIGAIQSLMTREVINRSQELGRELRTDEENAIADRLIRDFSTGKEDYNIEDLPVDLIQPLSEIIGALGNDVTHATLQKTYADYKQHSIKYEDRLRQLNMPYSEYHIAQAYKVDVMLTNEAKSVGLIVPNNDTLAFNFYGSADAIEQSIRKSGRTPTTADIVGVFIYEKRKAQ